LIAIAASLGGSTAHASAVSTDVALEGLHPALESGGMGCFDPQSWVWSAPRAERVALEITWDHPCEIGQPSCDRVAESVVEELTVDQASQFCALKLAQHEKSESEAPFDNELCLQSARELLSIDYTVPEPVDIGWQLVCRESDPECRSMPPVRQPIRDLTTSPSGVVQFLVVADTRDVDAAWPSDENRPRRGVRRRVDRPPTTI